MAIPFISELLELKGFYELFKLGYTKTRKWLKDPIRVEKLSDDVFSSRIEFGKIVTVEGKLSRYATTFRPKTYDPSIGAPTIRGNYYDPKSGLTLVGANVKIQSRTFQYPAQALPSFEDDAGRYCVAFLYSNDFYGLILEQTPPTGQPSEMNRFIIEAKNRPIPVLVPEDTLVNIAEKEVTITGVITVLPEPLVTAITKTLCPIRESIYYHFLRASSSIPGFCIDCRRVESSDVNAKRAIKELRSAIFVEGHFEGIIDDRYSKEYSTSLQGKGSSSVGTLTSQETGVVAYHTEDKYISVTHADFATFGFYIEVDLLDSRDYSRKLKYLRQYYKDFRRNVRNNIRKTSSFEARFKPDFLFDYRKQYAFHPDGVLASASAEETLHKNPDLKETADWLKNAKN